MSLLCVSCQRLVASGGVTVPEAELCWQRFKDREPNHLALYWALDEEAAERADSEILIPWLVHLPCELGTGRPATHWHTVQAPEVPV